MPRVKRALIRRKRVSKLFKASKDYFGGRKNLIRTAAAGTLNEARDETKHWTALHWAAECGAPAQLIGAMLAVDAEAAAAKDNYGKLPLDLAVEAKAAPEVLDLLRKASPPPESLAVAIERQDWEAIGRLGLATPEACAATDGEGYAPLHWAHNSWRQLRLQPWRAFPAEQPVRH
mgnify:CR=1 FL=1